jgi:hypothetical protein
MLIIIPNFDLDFLDIEVVELFGISHKLLDHYVQSLDMSFG